MQTQVTDTPSQRQGRGVAGWRARVAVLVASLRRVADLVPITPLGFALGLVGGWAFLGYAEDKADYVVLAAGAVALALVATAVVFVTGGALRLYLAQRNAPSGVSRPLTSDREVETGFRCPSLRFWPLVQVDIDWVEPGDVSVATRSERGWLLERVTPRERGRYESVTRRFTVRDIFGFSRVRFRHRWPQPLRVEPLVGKADVSLVVRRASSDGYSHPAGEPKGEMVEMRRYVAGDPARHIIWKAFARNRRLMVREPERAIAPRPAMVAFFIAATGDEPSASTARVFLDKDLLGADFVFVAEGAPRPTPDKVEALEQIIASRHHRDTQADGLAALFRTVDRARLDNLVVFAPARGGPWVAKLIAMGRRLPLPPMVILTVDGQTGDGTTPARWRRFLYGNVGFDPTLAALPGVYDVLQQAGMDLRVIHRGSGRRLERPQIEGLRAL